ncbi:unnamed protein product [Toxocara canis]|uniref:Velvet domain-containing protein n=1 Tax=Toxocara canis TaxID=6265 RepID=A0A183UPT7_TOXCA|nr:unnamed protein product [Toxocara canis]
MLRPSTYPSLPPAYTYLPPSNYVPYESRPNALTFDYSSPPRTHRRELLEQDLFLRLSGVPRELFDSEISVNEVRRSATAEDAVDDFASPTGFRLRRVKL